MMYLPLMCHMILQIFMATIAVFPSVSHCVDPLGLTRTMTHGWVSACIRLSLIETYLHF